MGRASIPVDAATKERPDRLKRSDEMWDDLLERLTAPAEPIEVGAWTDEQADRAKDSLRMS